MTLVQTEPKKICMWGNPPAPIVEYDQGEGTIVVQRRDIFTGTITESGTYTFQASLKSTSNWTSHLILYVNGNETVHFMKAGADGFLGFSKDVDLSSGDSVRIYGYHDLSGEVAYVAGTKLFKAELEPISSGISGTVSTGSPLYAVYNLSNPTPGVYRWNVGSRSNSNGINLYKSINGGAGELIASMTDGSYVDVQVSEGTTSLSLFYSMGSGSSTNISGGSVTVYPDSSSLVEKEIKRVTIRPNGVEKQIRPVTPGWQPDPSRTIFYYDFEDSNNRLADTSGNGNNATGASDITYEQVGGQYVAALSNGGGTITTNGLYGASIGTGDFAVSFWHYPVQPAGSNYPMMFGMSSNNSPYPGPNIFFDPHNKNGLGNKVIFRITGTTQKASTTSASSLYNGWHHIVMTRNSGVITCYIDANSEVSWTDGTTAFPTSGSNLGVLISRGSGSSQDFPAGAKGDKFILEKVGWSVADVTNYYNQTKSLYGIS